jgi:hypothetical protein
LRCWRSSWVKRMPLVSLVMTRSSTAHTSVRAAGTPPGAQRDERDGRGPTLSLPSGHTAARARGSGSPPPDPAGTLSSAQQRSHPIDAVAAAQRDRSRSGSDSAAAVRTAAALVLASLRRVASTSRVDLGQDGFARDTRGICANEGRDLSTPRCPSIKGSGLRSVVCFGSGPRGPVARRCRRLSSQSIKVKRTSAPLRIPYAGLAVGPRERPSSASQSGSFSGQIRRFKLRCWREPGGVLSESKGPRHERSDQSARSRTNTGISRSVLVW